ncbi:MAG: DUF86 domain-containing protein [Roseofilum sp. SBFL]|uniref:HepT-like ribonuclease domain-containing protein n=1 Tax=unclassified Roseofilum TaxID=2620099 RepID=UPI001B295F3D|nr:MULTISPECIES: HepT-like ribonuclease domain-containing protein [unclassified Roseofilum]MBP0011881.1 DUF86 domain-containing protein [Roseofilum sp. SID3]MBP0025501.1 DUF86 domain-containing protein [Roseofilum sp. SID2]MBP0037342.1 DUF86 domain-containing protein [Roseofilum sp. SID1]MBP0041571.1 DUF86 domain-containing protein [Roseofilum sp. SBFL]
MRSNLERIMDMQESIANIERYAARGKNAFFEDELIQTWILYHLQILGKAARSISHILRDRYPSVEWQKIIGFRNLTVHEYFRVDLNIVWRIVEEELLILTKDVELILKDFSEKGE